MPEEASEEGWYIDPYGLHEARWMSMNKPTKLVRDGEVESYQDPPDSQPMHPAIKIDPPVDSWTQRDTIHADDGSPETMPTIQEIDGAERNLVLSRWTGPFARSRQASERKTANAFWRAFQRRTDR
jgi:hypothetical protein